MTPTRRSSSTARNARGHPVGRVAPRRDQPTDRQQEQDQKRGEHPPTAQPAPHHQRRRRSAPRSEHGSIGSGGAAGSGAGCAGVSGAGAGGSSSPGAGGSSAGAGGSVAGVSGRSGRRWLGTGVADGLGTGEPAGPVRAGTRVSGAADELGSATAAAASAGALGAAAGSTPWRPGSRLVRAPGLGLRLGHLALDALPRSRRPARPARPSGAARRAGAPRCAPWRRTPDRRRAAPAPARVRRQSSVPSTYSAASASMSSVSLMTQTLLDLEQAAPQRRLEQIDRHVELDRRAPRG